MQSLTLDQAETLAEAGEAGAMAVSLVEAAALEQQHQLQQQEQEEESEGGLKGDGEEGEDVVSVEQCTGSDVQKASGDHEEKDEVQVRILSLFLAPSPLFLAPSPLSLCVSVSPSPPSLPQNVHYFYINLHVHVSYKTRNEYWKSVIC